jgi:hypothetical protein
VVAALALGCEAPTGTEPVTSLTPPDASPELSANPVVHFVSAGSPDACDGLHVVENGAVIGGVVKHGSYEGDDYTGERGVTAVFDNGTTPEDPPDQISFMFFGDYVCTNLDPDLFVQEGLSVSLRAYSSRSFVRA